MTLLRYLVALTLCLSAAGASVGQPSIVRDGTVGPGIEVQPTGPNFQIPQSLGELSGRNLFHSFSRFNIAPVESARFSATDPIDTVISRVTGDEASFLDGPLISDIPGADFFFLNPNGLVFGPESRVDVPGSFHATTASSIEFDTGAAFFANPRLDKSPSSVLRFGELGAFGFIGTPQAYRFASDAPAPVVIEATPPSNATDEQPRFRASALHLVGGDIAISGVPGSESSLLLFQRESPAIAILASAGSSGEIRREFGPAGEDLQPSEFTRLGTISVSATDVDVEAPLRVLADSILVDSGSLGADNLLAEIREVRLEQGNLSATQQLRLSHHDTLTILGIGSVGGTEFSVTAPTIRTEGSFPPPLGGGFGEVGPLSVIADVRLKGSRRVDLVNTSILALPFVVPGRGADSTILIEGGDISLVDSSVDASSFEGNGGEISILADNDLLLSGDARVTNVALGLFDSGGTGGLIRLEGDSVRHEGVSFISAQADGPQNGGEIRITARDTLTISSDISTRSFGSGTAGRIELTAPRARIAGDPEAPATSEPFGALVASATTGTGPGGDIEINVGTLEISEGARVLADSSGAGKAGTVAIRADESVTVVGTPTRVFLDDATVDSRLTTAISSASSGSGDAGTVAVSAPRIVVSDGGEITSEASGSGTAGSVILTASEVVELRGSRIDQIQALPLDPDAVLERRVPSRVSSSAVGSGAANEVVITAPQVLLEGGSVETSALVGPQVIPGEDPLVTEGRRQGNIAINASERVFLNGGRITASVVEGLGGDVVIRPGGSMILGEGSTIEARGINGSGGSVAIEGAESIQLRGASEITASAATDGGNITLSAGSLVALDGSRIVANSDTNGGVITVNAPVFRDLRQPLQADDPQLLPREQLVFDPLFDASGGVTGGSVNINSQGVNIQSGISALRTEFLDASRMVRPRCGAIGRPGGSFKVSRPRALPSSPEDLLLAFGTVGDGDPLGSGDDEPVPTATAPAFQTPVALRNALAAGETAFRGGDFEQAESSWSEASRILAEEGDPGARTDALRGLAQSQQALGRYDESVETLRTALEAAEESGDPKRIASTLGSLGNAYVALGDAVASREFLTRGIGIAKAAGDTPLAASLLNNYGNHHAAQRAYQEALLAYDESAHLASGAGDAALEVKALSNEARAALDSGQPERAKESLVGALEKTAAIGASHEKAYVLIHIAKSYSRLAKADPQDQAVSLLAANGALRQAVAVSRDIGDNRALSYALGNLGALYRDENRFDEALFLSPPGPRRRRRSRRPRLHLPLALADRPDPLGAGTRPRSRRRLSPRGGAP